MHCGGGPFNTARALARLGQPVSFLGCISDDSLGQRLRAALRTDGVDLDSLVATPLPTTLAFAGLDGDASASYRFYTDGTSALSLDAATALAALPVEFDALHFGSLGLMLEPLVDVVKASVEDLAWLEPGVGYELAARRLLDRGPRIVLVTRGADGATVVSSSGVATVPAPRVTVVDTIGAGDAFGAGFLAWWRHRGLGRDDLTDLDTAAEAARFACFVAARTVEQPGASPPRLAL